MIELVEGYTHSNRVPAARCAASGGGLRCGVRSKPWVVAATARRMGLGIEKTGVPTAGQ